MHYLIAALWTGCTCTPDAAVHDAYEAARSEALAPAPPVPEDWVPDALIQVAPPLFDELVEHALRDHGSIRRELTRMAVTLAPEVAVTEATLTAATDCPACVSADLDLAGTVDWTAPVLGTGTVPIRVRTRAVIELSTEQTDGGWEIRATPRTAEHVEVAVPLLPRPVLQLFDELLRDWVQEELREMPPKVAGRLSARYPIAALRLVPAGAGLDIEVHTTATRPGALQGHPPAPAEGWQIDVATASAVALARTHLFRAGPRTPLEVVGVPEAMGVLGNRLSVDLRVWRPVGVGWWRDLRAEGTLVVEGDDVVLTPTGVEVVAASPGAMWADPMSAAGEGLMVSEIEGAMHRRVRGVRSTALAGRTLTAHPTEVSGSEGGALLRIRGRMTIE